MKESTFRLHPAQQDVFIDQLIHVDSPRYNVGGYIILKGTVNLPILQQIVHVAPTIFDAFKLRFDAHAPDLIGYINENDTSFELGEKDFSLEVNPAVSAGNWMQEKMNTPFLLREADCLFEQVLFTIAPDEYWLFGRFHHLVLDGYGFIVWVEYMADAYRALINRQHIDFFYPSYLEEAALANTVSAGPFILANNSYWKEKLKTKPDKLFHQKKNLSEGEAPAAIYTYELTHSEREQLEAFAKAKKAGIHQLTIAALIIYFGKTTAAERFVFGLPVHKRNSGKLRKIVGLFNGFIPFQGVYEAGQTIADLIRTVVSSQAADYRHQDFKLSDLVSFLQINPAEENLWEIIVNYFPLQAKLDFSDDIQASVYRLLNEHGNTPVQVCWNDYGRQQPLELQVHFSKAHFDKDDIRLFTHRLLYILSQFTNHQHKNADEILLIPNEELAMLAAFGNKKIAETIYTEPIPYPDYLIQIADENNQLLPVGVQGYLCFSEKRGNEVLIERTSEILKTDVLAKWTSKGELIKVENGLADLNYKNKEGANPLSVSISASFVAEPLEEYLTFWSNEFELGLEVSFAPYNQVFQQLLHPDSLFNTGSGINILLLRVEDWLRELIDQPVEQQIAFLQKTYEQFIEAVAKARKLSAKPYLFGIIPWLLNTSLGTLVQKKIQEIEQAIRQTLSGITLFYELDIAKAATSYNVQDIFDPKSDELGHIPFTEEFFAALGTFISRKIRAWKAPAYKVIALDCDNTLWKGICGETGPLQVVIDDDYQHLQEFLIRKHTEGFLLVLCSKNNEEDVWEVFDNHPKMKLKREHIIGHKIDWQPKPLNLQSLAKELNLSTDSFIFLDDNPFEIEQMSAACPDVLAIALPPEQENIPAFLEHTWVFDLFQITEEDKLRNRTYTAEKRRKEDQASYKTINDFLLSLNVEVTARKLTEKELDRAMQLIQRTNQFNLNGIKRSHEELVRLMNDHSKLNLIVEVADRFGDYGIVGLILAKPENSKLVIKTFLLSCRVLGRNVEDIVMNVLTQHCNNIKLHTISAQFQPTGKNKLFSEFLKRTNWTTDPLSDNYNYKINYSGEKFSHTPNEKQTI